jgi:hypothetical protein
MRKRAGLSPAIAAASKLSPRDAWFLPTRRPSPVLGPGLRRVRGCLIGNRGARKRSGRPARVSSEPVARLQGLTARGLPYGTRVPVDLCPEPFFGFHRLLQCEAAAVHL